MDVYKDALQLDNEDKTCNWCQRQVKKYELIHPNIGEDLVLCDDCKKQNDEALNKVLDRFCK